MRTTKLESSAKTPTAKRHMQSLLFQEQQEGKPSTPLFQSPPVNPAVAKDANAPAETMVGSCTRTFAVSRHSFALAPDLGFTGVPDAVSSACGDAQLRCDAAWSDAPATDLLDMAPAANKLLRAHSGLLPLRRRASAWMRWSGAEALKAEHGPGHYAMRLSSRPKSIKRSELRQIEVDLPRTCPEHPYLRSKLTSAHGDSLVHPYPHGSPGPTAADAETDASMIAAGLCIAAARPPETPAALSTRFYADTGTAALRRILTAFVFRYPGLGYLQSMNYLAAMALIVLGDEEDAFWLLCALAGEGEPCALAAPTASGFGNASVRRTGSSGGKAKSVVEAVASGDRSLAGALLPSYFAPGMPGFRIDCKVVCNLVRRHIPAVHGALEGRGLTLDIVLPKWLLCGLFNTLYPPQLLHVWDIFFAAHAKARAATSSRGTDAFSGALLRAVVAAVDVKSTSIVKASQAEEESQAYLLLARSLQTNDDLTEPSNFQRLIGMLLDTDKRKAHFTLDSGEAGKATSSQAVTLGALRKRAAADMCVTWQKRDVERKERQAASARKASSSVQRPSSSRKRRRDDDGIGGDAARHRVAAPKTARVYRRAKRRSSTRTVHAGDGKRKRSVNRANPLRQQQQQENQDSNTTAAGGFDSLKKFFSFSSSSSNNKATYLKNRPAPVRTQFTPLIERKRTRRRTTSFASENNKKNNTGGSGSASMMASSSSTDIELMETPRKRPRRSSRIAAMMQQAE